MIKNDANKCAKQIHETKSTSVTTASVTLRQQTSDIDNRHAIQKSVNKYNEVDDNDSVGKPLSKKDLIKKFDIKYNQPNNTVDNKQSHRTSYAEDSQNINPIDVDEVENDENIQNSNNEEINVTELRNRPANDAVVESTTVANNNYKNGNTLSGNGNGNEMIPPKPLPRTSRNNSVSSLSSEHSISISNIVVVEETTNAARPVAKPRTTTTTSYKVQHPHTSITLLF